MITLVEALNYRCLRYIHRPMKPFHILVGPNASGKTTFLDVIGFLSDLVSDGLDAALSKRSANPQELLFQRQGSRMELAVEAKIPDSLRKLTLRPELDTVRYEAAIGFDETERQFEFKEERLLLKKRKTSELPLHPSFPMLSEAPDSLLTNIKQRSNKVIINKTLGGNDSFYSEIYRRSGSGWKPSFRLGSQKSALGNLLADENSFPVATWFKDYLSAGVQNFMLDSRAIKRPSPPTRVAGFLPDGSNLPWVVARMRKENKESYTDWLAHLRTALPDLLNITITEREEDRHCYMSYEYAGSPAVPSWLVSDGTLRLTALTLPAYLADLKGTYLIEEPENGIHPKAVSTAYDSLKSMYDAQVLLATHSSVVLSDAEASDVLCFAKNGDGSTDIALGSEHPALRDWKSSVDLGTLLASGVLG